MSGPEQEPKADAAAWLAVAGGSLGALMATLDISIVNSALPTIQGEIGASGVEGTWVSTAYLVAEIIIIPLTAWLQRLLGLRTLLLIAASLFTVFSMVCGIADDLTTMIIGRTGQGFTGGALLPTAMTIVATRLPRAQQPIGNAMYGLTAIVGPVIGPLLGGWLTENISWHYSFFLNLPIGVVLLLLLIFGLKHERPNLQELWKADWLGIVGMTLGLAGLTIVLEEGQREQWFESRAIVTLSAVSAIGFAMLILGQLQDRRPVIKLSLLMSRQFGAVATMAFVLGMVIYGSSYMIPQFLAAIAGYDALQSGLIVVLAGVPALILIPFIPLMIRFIDIRLSVGVGLLAMALSCWLDTSLTAQSAGDAFVLSQLLRGAGTIFSFVFLSQAAITSANTADAGDAAGLFAAIRNVGGSIALAGIATVQDQRVFLHSRRIEESMLMNSDRLQAYLAGLGEVLGGPGAAIRSLAGTLQREALVMTVNDLFFILAAFIVAILPLVLLLRPLPKGQKVSLH